jgi:hypothetical protein
LIDYLRVRILLTPVIIKDKSFEIKFILIRGIKIYRAVVRGSATYVFDYMSRENIHPVLISKTSI